MTRKVWMIDAGGSTMDVLATFETEELANECLELWRNHMGVHDDGWNVTPLTIRDKMPEYWLGWTYNLYYDFNLMPTVRYPYPVTPGMVGVTVERSGGFRAQRAAPQQECHFDWEQESDYTFKKEPTVIFADGSGHHEGHWTWAFRGYATEADLLEAVEQIKVSVTTRVRAGMAYTEIKKDWWHA